MTLGELGSVDGKENLSPSDVAQVREQEFVGAMTSLGFSHKIFDLNDYSLSVLPLENLAIPLINILRQKDLAAVFSFHPFEITPGFDHPDHNAAGIATRFAASALDIKNLSVGVDESEDEVVTQQGLSTATSERPELYFWTTNKNQATHQLKMSEKSQKSRRRYLKKNYPSQFPKRQEKRWGTIFDRLGKKEYYQQVR